MVDLVHTKGERTMQIKTVDGDRDVASKGLAGTALGLGIAGTVGLLNQWANGGCNGGFFNNGFFGRNGCGCGCGNNGYYYGSTGEVANHDTRVIGALESKIAKLEGERYTDGVGIELYREIIATSNKNDEKIQSNYVSLAKAVAELDKQIAVDKKETECNFAFLNNRITESARELRCYVDATFVPGTLKMPLQSICPEAMPRYNSWTAPTAVASDVISANVVESGKK